MYSSNKTEEKTMKRVILSAMLAVIHPAVLYNYTKNVATPRN